jgi:acyl dehydratase
MSMDIHKIRTLRFRDVTQRYEARDTILYALGLGYGADPLDERELPFVYEENLKAVPSMCCVLAQPGFWLRDPTFGVDWVSIVHAEQSFEIYSPIASTGAVTGAIRVLGIEDKGADKGALLTQQKTLVDAATGRDLALVRSAMWLRRNGGEGGFGETAAASPALPTRDPDRAVEISTQQCSALIYRLSGDWNPIHADPKTARKAGFDRPILHGLCTAGIACRAILSSYCGNETGRLKSMSLRFSNPVFPGDTIRLEFYEQGAQIRFRAVAVARGVVVLDRGSAVVALQ